MTFIELIRELVHHAPLPEPVIRDAEKLLTELEQLNAFGTVLGHTETEDHQYLPRSTYDPRCKYCGKTTHERKP